MTGRPSNDRPCVYQMHVPPWDDALTRELEALALQVFGAFDLAELRWKLVHMPDVTLHAARAEGQLVGFKLGYASTYQRYFSWLGGVHADHRRRGVASRLMADQHARAAASGYSQVESGCIQGNTAMLALNLRVGFSVIGMYCRKGPPRVMLLKELERGAARASVP